MMSLTGGNNNSRKLDLKKQNTDGGDGSLDSSMRMPDSDYL